VVTELEGAASDGLRVWDKVLSVDGTDLGKRKLANVLLSLPREETHTLRVKRCSQPPSAPAAALAALVAASQAPVAASVEAETVAAAAGEKAAEAAAVQVGRVADSAEGKGVKEMPPQSVAPAAASDAAPAAADLSKGRAVLKPLNNPKVAPDGQMAHRRPPTLPKLPGPKRVSPNYGAQLSLPPGPWAPTPPTAVVS